MDDYRHPDEIPGWLSRTEGMTLAELARGREVLELGAWHGRSTVCCARTARRVTTVDHFRGDAGTGPGDGVEARLLANLDRYGVAGRVRVLAGEIGSVELPAASFDLVFVDSAHDGDSVARDLAVAARCVKPGGVIALHDWDYPAVRRAAADVLGWTEPDRASVVADRLYARRYNPPPPPRVFVAVPHRNGVCPGLVTGFVNALGQAAVEVATFRLHSSSLLTLCFNSLWAMALNEREDLKLTHFCMHHADISPEDGWLTTLVGELASSGADVVSAVVPIKDPRGLSSTAVMDPETRVMRRLTIRECLDLPRTFSAAEAGYPGHWLLVNSGLWVCDFTKPWVEEVCFTIRDKIIKDRAGKFAAMCFSEDWVFSVDAQRMGLKLRATTAVKLRHTGELDFPNDVAWGAWETDHAHDDTFDPPPQEDLFPVPHVEPAENLPVVQE